MVWKYWIHNPEFLETASGMAANRTDDLIKLFTHKNGHTDIQKLHVLKYTAIPF